MIFNLSCMMYFYDDSWFSQSQLQYFAIYSEQYPTYFTVRGRLSRLGRAVYTCGEPHPGFLNARKYPSLPEKLSLGNPKEPALPRESVTSQARTTNV